MGADQEALKRMERLSVNWQQASDRRAVFLNCYAMMTANMLLAIERQEFEDNPWVTALVEHFASYYFTALENFESGRPVPTCWRVAFEAARRDETHVLQNLILGVNAHINYDLVLAVADLLEPEWATLNESQRGSRHRDYCRVNEVIGLTVDAVQDQIVERQSPTLQIVDVVLGPLDEWLTIKLISRWRENVWDHASELAQKPEAERRLAILKEVDSDSMRQARIILGEEGYLGLSGLL